MTSTTKRHSENEGISGLSERQGGLSKLGGSSTLLAGGSGQRWLMGVVAALLLALIYFVSAKLGLRLAFVHANATAVWPPTGISIAALLILGPRLWPGVFLGAFLANITTQGTLASAFGIAAGNTLEGLVAAYWVRRAAGGIAAFCRPQNVLKFTLIAAIFSTTVSATLGVVSLALTGFALWSNFQTIWLTWWLGDAVGALIVAPLILTWAAEPRIVWERRTALELMFAGSTLVAVGLLVFGGALERSYALEFLCLPLLVWIGYRFGPRTTACGIALLAGLALWGTLRGYGPFADQPPHRALLLLQAFMGTVALTAFVLAAAMAERRRIAAALTERDEQLRQAQKMEAVGQLAGGVAHDFNNIMTAILGYTDLALDRSEEEASRRQYLEEIREAGLRAVSLTQQLLAFGRRQILQPTALSLNEVVRGMKRMLTRLLGEDIELVLQLDRELPFVTLDRRQLEMVLLNLAANARDAMPHGGQLTLATTTAFADDLPDPPADVASSQGYVVLQVKDTGEGMDEATQAHVFEPFFTTKGPGKGTGLGLATAYGIVRQSHGYITVESEPGAGTCFSLHFPPASRELSPSEPELEFSIQGNGTGTTIVLVEDEEAVREVLRRALDRSGYDVLEAHDGEEALTLLEDEERSVDLLLTDVVMPHLGGRQLAEKLAVSRPGLKVLFISGYTEDAALLRELGGSDWYFLSKPFTSAELIRKLDEVLGE